MKAKDLPLSTKSVDLELGFYYVSCVDNNDNVAIALGPFECHVIALDCVDECREFMSNKDAWSDFWKWGTLRLKDGIIKGKLNEFLLKRELDV